ncbi:MAG: TonB-dependent receptor, partial [Bacteroidales bacterium]|nr:TonB-dependent receptor [Bacteroidales bacterium]
ISVAAGIRGTYVLNIYEGGLKNISLSYTVNPSVLGPYADALNAFAGDKELDCTQKDIVFTPVIGIDVNYGKFNFAGRYEFRGDVDLENSTKKNTTGMAQYDDKAVVSSDIPALLALGARYSLLPQFRVMVDYNLYFDKQSNVYNSLTGKDDKTSLIENNPYEVIAGLEYDLTGKWTVSGGVQFTRFGYGKKAEYISDMSFNPSSVSVGLGCRYKLNDKISFDFGVFKTFYEHINKEMDDYNNVGASLAQKIAAAAPALAGSISADALKTPGKDNFFRKSFVAGIGFNYAF